MNESVGVLAYDLRKGFCRGTQEASHQGFSGHMLHRGQVLQECHKAFLSGHIVGCIKQDSLLFKVDSCSSGSHIENKGPGWRDGAVVKSSGCSSRGPVSYSRIHMVAHRHP